MLNSLYGQLIFAAFACGALFVFARRVKRMQTQRVQLQRIQPQHTQTNRIR